MKMNFSVARALRDLICLAGLWAALASAPVTSAQPTNFPHTLADLRTQLDARLNEPRFSGATWSVKAVSLTTGKTVYEQHADRLMSPASNSKLYTGALALSTLGGDYQIKTPVYATIRPDDFGRVNGDVIVSGRADPSWKAGTNFWDNFTPFIAILTNMDIRRITGDLVMDTTFLHGPPSGGGWTVDDLEDSDGAEISALTLEDNTAQIRATPGAAVGDPCAFTIVQPDTGITLVNRTKTVAHNGDAILEVRKLPGTKTFYIFGQLALGAKVEILDEPVPEPAAWFGAALKEALIKNGIAVDGNVRCIAWPETPAWSETSLVKLGEVKSPALRELVRGFMKPSQNLETDLIFEHVGELSRTANAPTWRTSESLALRALDKFLAAKKIPADVHFDEGSGLSRNNLTSAQATVALLQMMAAGHSAQDYYNALPIAGVDGTLRRRMKGTPAFQNVRAKTGTLRWANSLSGHVTTAGGEKLVFSLMLNRYATSAEVSHTAELDYIAELLAGFTGRSDE
ncbi:MAG TPA: D-alanyl-D-alanine carboxypeptidase/D-alanyl-D-alanine-endopeptidase [Verrucomicrobiae bacterium]